MGTVLKFLQSYQDEGEFLSKIVTVDETWARYKNQERKEQSKQWMHSNSSDKPKELKQTSSIRKYMAMCSGAEKEFPWWNTWNLA